MPKADLQQWLISRSGFRERYLRVLKESVASQFQSLQRADEAPQTEDWPYLLFCASILADSDRSDCQDTALRIAQACMTHGRSRPEERDAAAVVLDDLANRIAIDLSIDRELLRPGLQSRLGAVARIEWTRRSAREVVEGLVVDLDADVPRTSATLSFEYHSVVYST
jgi:hypothetical protein